MRTLDRLLPARRGRALAALACAALVAVALADWARSADPPAAAVPRGSDWLNLLPAGEPKRRFILDCAGCHGVDARIVRSHGKTRSAADWAAATERMLRYGGATTGFPVIAHDRNAAATGAFLAAAFAKEPVANPRKGLDVVRGAVTEYEISEAQDLPHDVAIDAEGRVVVTGMFTHRMLVLDPASGRIDSVEIPDVQNPNPRAVEIDSSGAWWIGLGQPRTVARYSPASKEWKLFRIGHYPHSVAVGRDGAVWANAHFGRDPELIFRMRPGAPIDSMPMPLHPTLGVKPGGPIPYEIRVGPDGRVWLSELQGNRIVVYDPATDRARAIDMPIPHMGPRRFDVDRDGVLWIPAFAANELVRYDPKTAKFQRFPLPVADAVPYVARVDDAKGIVWIGTSAADAVFAFDRKTSKFTLYELPSPGAMVRHMAIDPRTHEVWLAYGASPGPLSSRIARLKPRS